jgi:hypothetical protein
MEDDGPMDNAEAVVQNISRQEVSEATIIDVLDINDVLDSIVASLSKACLAYTRCQPEEDLAGLDYCWRPE